MIAMARPIISLLLYLCADEAKIGDGTRRPVMPRPKRTKAGWRLFAADNPTAWGVGVRLGAAITGRMNAPKPNPAMAHTQGRERTFAAPTGTPTAWVRGDPVPNSSGYRLSLSMSRMKMRCLLWLSLCDHDFFA